MSAVMQRTGSSVEIYDWSTAERQVGSLWAGLVATGGYNPSLHPEWLGFTLEVWGLKAGARVAVVRDGESVSIIPFLQRRVTVLGVPVRCVDLCSNVLAYHAEIVTNGSVDRALELFLTDRRVPAWDAVRLGNLPTTGATAQAARSVRAPLISGISVRAGERSPYVPITAPWQDYLKTRPKKLRANITRCDRLMQQAGESGMKWYTTGDDTRELLAEMLEIEKHSWKQDAGISIKDGAPESAYYERLLPWLARHGLLANVLFVRERPVAYVLCANWHGWVGQLKTSFSTELRDAGARVIQTSLERAISLGAREYDFLGDAAFHKLRWTDSIRAHEDVWLFSPALRGRAVAQLKRLTDHLHARRAARATTETSSNEP
jgi:CelD/BcsL family acetyltransferase involved in cellulose biosynthesis